MPSPSTPVAPDAAKLLVDPTSRGADLKERARAAAVSTGKRFVTSVRPALPAIIGYLLARVVNLVVLAVMSRAAKQPFWGMVGSWDGEWFRDIADFGYVEKLPVAPTGKPYWVNVEFFPGYPYLVRVVSNLTGLDSMNAGMVVTFASGAVAAWGLYALGRHLTGSHRTATIFALLWAVAPGSMVLTMVYSEALFVAFASWGLLAIVKRQWTAALILCICAGLTRNTSFALVAALGVAALQVVLTKREDGTRVGLLGREARRPVVATVLAPAGVIGFILWVGYVGKRWDAWFWIQDKAFNLRFDGGTSTVRLMYKYLTEAGKPVYIICTFVIFLSVALMVWSFRDRKIPLPVHVYGGLVMVLALTTSNGWFFQSKPRFMLPAFTIALPLAALMARWPRKVAAVLLVAGAAFSGWYVGYLVYVIDTNP